MIEISRWIHSVKPGWRLRLYLVDLPEGMSVRTLAITVVAPEERIDEVIAESLQAFRGGSRIHPRFRLRRTHHIVRPMSTLHAEKPVRNSGRKGI